MSTNARALQCKRGFKLKLARGTCSRGGPGTELSHAGVPVLIGHLPGVAPASARGLGLRQGLVRCAW